MDLRSREKEKRTLHWFVNGKQQKGFIKGVPDRVEFGVSYYLLLFLFFYYHRLFLLFISIMQVCTYWENDSIEFVRLEELKEPSVKSIDGEKGYEW